MEKYDSNYSLLGEQFLYDATDVDQQAYYAGAIGPRKAYTPSPISSGMQTSPFTFDDYKAQEIQPLDIKNLVLPPPNFSCYVEPPVAQGTVQYFKHTEPTLTRTITLNFNSTKTVVRENVIHHQHTQTVITNVNRNHWHTQRVVVRDNNYHHYLINNVVKINDIHHQRIEHVRGESKSFKDYKQTQQIQTPACDFTDKDAKVEIVSQSLPLTPIQNSSSPNNAIPTMTS